MAKRRQKRSAILAPVTGRSMTPKEIHRYVGEAVQLVQAIGQADGHKEKDFVRLSLSNFKNLLIIAMSHAASKGGAYDE